MLKFLDYTKRLTKSPAVTGTLIVTLGALLGSVFSYLLQFFLGRTLSVSDFGVFNALLSFSVILSVLSGSLSTALIKAVAEIKAGDRFDILTQLFRRLTVVFLILGAFVFIAVFSLKSQIANFLRIGELSFISGFAVYLSLAFLAILAPAFLQGLLRFKAFAFWGVLSSILRFSIPAILVLVGFRVGAVFIGMGLSMILSYFIATLLLKKNFALFEELPLKKYYKSILLFAGPVLFVYLGMTILNNADVILVKHYFEPEQAGLYAGVVTLGKILLFGAGTVSVVMYPQISTAYAKKENPFKKIEPFLMLQLAILVCGVLIFSLLPGLITRIMFGERFLPSMQYLPRFSLFIGFYVIANFFTLFLLAINKTKIFIFHIVAVILQLFLINSFHGNIRQVIDMNLITATFLSSALLGYFLYLFQKQIKSQYS